MRLLKSAVIAALLAPALALGETAASSSPAPESEAKPEAPPAATVTSAPEPVALPASIPGGAETPEAQKAATGFRMGVSLDHNLGHGTFINPIYSVFDGSIGLSPSYAFKLRDMKLSASARASLSWEYTLPDNESGRRGNWSDLRLGLSAPAVFTEKKTGISVSPSLGALVPLSPNSWRAHTITVLSLGVGASRTFGKFDLSYKFGLGKGFHSSPLMGGDVAEAEYIDATGARTCLARPGEATCNVFGTNTDFSISNGVDVNFRALEKLSFSAGISFSNSFKYTLVSEVDEYTPKAVDSNGNPVARTGYGRGDKMSGTLAASYSINDTLAVSAGMSTSGPPKTRDNKNWRFPFFDFVSPEDSLTGYSVSLSASF